MLQDVSSLFDLFYLCLFYCISFAFQEVNACFSHFILYLLIFHIFHSLGCECLLFLYFILCLLILCIFTLKHVSVLLVLFHIY